MRKLTSLLKSLSLSVLSLLFWTSLSGQVTVFASHEAGDPGQTVKVEVKVSDFDTMLSSQFTLRYDTLILEYSAVGDYGIFNINNQNFGVPAGPFPTPKGIVTFLWIADNIITGQTQPDSSILFSVSFKIIGSNGQVSPIQFSGNPTEIEFGNLSGEIPYNAYDGSVTVGTSATSEIITEDFLFPPVSPNPIEGEARIAFSLNQASKTSISIFDTAGKPIYQHTEKLGSGPQVITLQKDIFPAPGMYYIRLTTENAQAVQKLIVAK